jgi:hypothetical protein
MDAILSLASCSLSPPAPIAAAGYLRVSVLVNSPDQWPWSSFRFYYLNVASVLAMERLG